MFEYDWQIKYTMDARMFFFLKIRPKSENH